jgi:hypothetical protein
VRELFSGRQVLRVMKEVKPKTLGQATSSSVHQPATLGQLTTSITHKPAILGQQIATAPDASSSQQSLIGRIDDKANNILSPSLTLVPAKTSPFPGIEYGMDKWLISAMAKFPNDYKAGAKDKILDAVKTSQTVTEFNAKIDQLQSQGEMGVSAAKYVKMAFDNRIKSPTFLIEGNRRAGHENVEISIPIAKCSHLTLTEKNLGSIFQIANQHTLNTQYHIQNTSKMINGQMVHRPNHNGTHSARQVGYLEAMFDLIEKEGLPQAKQQLNQLTQDEKLNLKLAVYFLRAGRVDESSHKNPPADDYYTRSALIYEAYAKQLGVDPAMIDWTKKLIVDSCKPLAVCQEATKSEKSKFIYDLMTTAHELDLVRCFDKKHIDANMQGTEKRLGGLIVNPNARTPELYDFAKKLCEATGCSRRVDNHPGDKNLFANCSVNGDACWQAVQGAGLPQWT